MKQVFLILIIFLTIALPSETHGQMLKNVDSVHVNYWQFNGGHLINTTLAIERWTMSFYIEKNQPLVRASNENVLLYRTHKYKTIEEMFSYIDAIINNPPIYDTTFEIVDLGEGMTISVFENNEVREYRYSHYPDAYFPLAYIRLYCFIQQTIAKYIQKKE